MKKKAQSDYDYYDTYDPFWDEPNPTAVYEKQRQQKRKRMLVGVFSAFLIAVVTASIIIVTHRKTNDMVFKDDEAEVAQTVPRMPDEAIEPKLPSAYSEGPMNNQNGHEALDDVEYGFYGMMLTDVEKSIYATFVQALEQGETEISVEGMAVSSIEHAYDAILEDYPEFFWLAGGYTWTEYPNETGSTIVFDVWTLNTIYDKQTAKADVEKIVSDIILQTQGMSDYEKVLFVHDYLVNWTSYDYDTYITGADTNDSHTAYGCLVKHQAVCAGYSRAFQWLMKALGYECLRVAGYDIDTGEAHEWNCVKLGGKYYYVDVTWDDPLNLDGSQETLEHDYFCITSDELLETHIIEDGQNEPWCTATQYDYYRMQGTYIDTYDIGMVETIIRNNMAQGATGFVFKFSSPMECEKASADLLDRRKIFDITGYTGTVYSKVSRNGRVFKISF